VFSEDGTSLEDLSEKEQEKKLMVLVQYIFDYFEGVKP